MPSPIAPRKHELQNYCLQGEYLQPRWEDMRTKRTRWISVIVWVFIVIGVGLAGFICYATLQVDRNPCCLVQEDAFSASDLANWINEVQVDDFGTGSFDWTTMDPTDSCTDSEGLHIVTAITTKSTSISNEQLSGGRTLNLTKAGGVHEHQLYLHTRHHYPIRTIRPPNDLGYGNYQARQDQGRG